MQEAVWLDVEIRKKTLFFLVCPQSLQLGDLKLFYGQSLCNTTRLPVQRTAEQETGRNMEGVGEEEGGLCVCVCVQLSGSCSQNCKQHR